MKMTRREMIVTSGIPPALYICGCLSRKDVPIYNSVGTDDRGVYLLIAGSLLRSVEIGMRKEIAHNIRVESHGSVTIARLILEGLKNPDIISLSDPILFDKMLGSKWYVEFASNEIVIAYNDSTKNGRLISEYSENNWYENILKNDIRVGITDAEMDPLGYRTLFMLYLASVYYGEDDIEEGILAKSLMFPETELMSYFDIGAVDAVFVYKNMAVSRGYKYIELPPEINLGEPSKIKNWYSTAEYRFKNGDIVYGDCIKYGSTISENGSDSVVLEVFKQHIMGEYIADFGFKIPEDYPRLIGKIPRDIERHILE